MKSYKRGIYKVILLCLSFFLIGTYSLKNDLLRHDKLNLNSKKSLTRSYHSSNSQVLLTNLPPNTSNTRFGSIDGFSSFIVRPGLSIRGFNSSNMSGGNDFGLGLKKILEGYFSGDEEFEVVINKIITQANDSLIVRCV